MCCCTVPLSKMMEQKKTQDLVKKMQGIREEKSGDDPQESSQAKKPAEMTPAELKILNHKQFEEHERKYRERQHASYLFGQRDRVVICRTTAKKDVFMGAGMNVVDGGCYEVKKDVLMKLVQYRNAKHLNFIELEKDMMKDLKPTKLEPEKEQKKKAAQPKD